MNRPIILLCCWLLPAWLSAQSFEQAKMDRLFDQLEKYHQGMGSLSLSQGGEVVYQRAIGYADLATEQTATPETRYCIGSISKVFTAVLVLKATEAGDLTLETPLAEYFPSMPNAGQITVEHLLRHRSGLVNYTDDSSYQDYMEQPITREELLNKFQALGTDFEPGERFEYSNTNYTLLTFILEEVSGQSYPELLQAQITDPLELSATYYGGSIDLEALEARSYEVGRPWEPSTETDMSVPQGAGALVSTAEDLNHFLRGLFEGKLIADSSLEKMMPLQDGYGLGLTAFPFGSKTAYGHNGGIDGFQGSAAYFPAEDLAVAYLSNGVNHPLNDVLIGVLSIYFGADYEIPDFAALPQISDQELDSYVGLYQSPRFPLDIDIARQGSRLMLQATGQPQVPLRAEGEQVFSFKQSDLEVEFTPESDEMILRQNGMEWTLKRE